MGFARCNDCRKRPRYRLNGDIPAGLLRGRRGFARLDCSTTAGRCVGLEARVRVNRHSLRIQSLAVGLSALAGYVDASGFIALHGYFVSFMSGNSTRLAVGIAEDWSQVSLVAGLMGTFVAGVVVGLLTGHFAGTRRSVVVLALVSVLLGAAAAFGMARMRGTAIIAMGLAMGAENATFGRDGEVQIGLTYMTGTLVKVGQRVAAALLGNAPLAWLPYLLMWCGLVAGAVVGALVYPRLGFASLWIAAFAAASLAAFAVKARLPD